MHSAAGAIGCVISCTWEGATRIHVLKVAKESRLWLFVDKGGAGAARNNTTVPSVQFLPRMHHTTSVGHGVPAFLQYVCCLIDEAMLFLLRPQRYIVVAVCYIAPLSP